MKIYLIIILITVLLTGVLCYRIGYAQGQSNCPIKYAVCENGTCIIRDSPPDYSGK